MLSTTLGKKWRQPIPNLGEAVEQLPSFGKPWNHCPSPSLGKPWSHCPSPHWGSSGAIAHPQHWEAVGKQWSHYRPPLWGSRGAIAHHHLWGRSTAIAHSQPRTPLHQLIPNLWLATPTRQPIPHTGATTYPQPRGLHKRDATYGSRTHASRATHPNNRATGHPQQWGSRRTVPDLQRHPYTNEAKERVQFWSVSS